MDLVSNTSRYDSKLKRWFVSIPFRENVVNLGDNYASAFAVMKSVERSVTKRGAIEQVNQTYEDFVLNDYARKLPFSELKQNMKTVHTYIPSFVVFSPNKQTSRCRMVMNFSSKTQTGESVNSLSYPGPSLVPDITIMLTKFRTGKIVLLGDVKHMFLQIKLATDTDRNCCRFLWREMKLDSPPQEYEMLSLPFGLSASPYISSWCIKTTAKMFSEKYPLGSQIAEKDTYIDDIVTCVDNEGDLVKALDELQNLFKEISMTIHKFNSNLPILKSLLPEDLLSKEIETKVLGQTWHSLDDVILFNFTETDLSKNTSHCTKRTFLSEVSSLFDPIGILSPLLLHIKGFFQLCWKENIDWDALIPEDINEKWLHFKEQLPLLSNFRLPRALVLPKAVKYHSLITFCDSSLIGYGAVTYLFSKYTDGSISVRFVMSKARIKPLKPISSDEDITIVRMELLSILVGVRLAVHLRNGLLEKLALKSYVFFTDSAINFHRLRKGYANFKPWVSRRLCECLTHFNAKDFLHLPTELNVADYLSRGETDMNAFLEKTEWLNGPQFLYEKPRWDSYSKINSMKATPADLIDVEINKPVNVAKVKVISNDFYTYLSTRYSNWNKTIRLVAYLMRFCNKSHKKFCFQPLTPEELHLSELKVFNLIQQNSFGNDFQLLAQGEAVGDDSPLVKFNPFMKNNVIHSNSRLVFSKTLTHSEKFPILLPSHCPLVETMVLTIHKSHFHLGLSHLLAKVRARFIILGGRRQITRILNLCSNRACQRIVPLQQQMAPLPADRLDGTSPFRNVSLDYIGPFFINGFEKSVKTQTKVWIAIFTCFLTRAVHLELVLDLTTTEVLNAVRLFVSRRGLPSTLYSDNQTSFKAANKEMKTLLSNISWNKLSRFALEKGFHWQFNIPGTPWTNGLTERLVKSVKISLRKVFGKTPLTFRQFSILLTELEVILNTRPLSPVTDSSQIPVSPFQLIYGRKFESLPVQQTSKHLTFPDLWLKRKNFMKAFWNSFKHDYLLSLGVRKKWRNVNSKDLLNQVVLLNDSNIPQFTWRQGIVIGCLPSKDGLVRQVEVRLPEGNVVRRSVHTLSLFENDFESAASTDE